MATQNAINNQNETTTDLTIDPGASGDSYVQYSINSVGEFRVGVDDTDDSFRISQGSSLGTTDTFVMTAAGERTMPLQPAFLAYNSAIDSNVTGDGTIFTIIFDTEVFDQNSDFDGTSTFTAPVTGRYLLGFNVALEDIGAAHTNGLVQTITSNRTYQTDNFSPTILDVSGDLTMGQVVLADMDAADTATFVVRILNSTLTVDVAGGGDMVTVAYAYLAV